MLAHPFTSYDAEHRVWSGAKCKNIYNDKLTLGEIIYDQLSKNPKKIIQITDVTGEKLTCEKFLKYAELLAQYLLKSVVKSGNIIGIYAGNSTYVGPVVLAAFLCGTPLNPVFPGFTTESLSMAYKTTRPKVIFCDVKNYENVRIVNEELQLKAMIIIVNGTVEGVANVKDILDAENAKVDTNFRYPCLDLKGDDNAAIFFSSGTTGPPKGVLVSHGALLNQKIILNLKADSILFCFSTLYWISGMWILIASLTNACLRITTEQNSSPEYFLDIIKRYKVTHALGAPVDMGKILLTHNELEIQNSLESIDSLLVGGAKVPIDMQKKLVKILSNNTNRPGLTLGYGISELGGIVICTGGYQTQETVGAEGKLMPNLQVRIIGEDGKHLALNERGMVCIKLSHKWTGYYQNEEATKKTLVDDWLYTGDIGYFDDNGLFHYCSRAGDIFKSRSFQIHPQTIENIIIQVPGVSEVCVFGFPDLVATNLIACAVIRTVDANGSKLTAQLIEHKVSNELNSSFHLSGGVYFLDVMPKTPSGKLQRQKVPGCVQGMINRNIV